MENILENLLISYKIMVQILTRVSAIKVCRDINFEFETIFPDFKSKGFFSTNTHFLLTNAYLSELTIIFICSFLDEYNKHFNANNCLQLRERVKRFKKQIKPVLNRINEWKGLKNYRNVILAHNLRTKMGDPIMVQNADKMNFNIPKTPQEFELLFQLVALITQNIAKEFPELMDKLELSEKITDSISFVGLQNDTEQEFNIVASQIKNSGLTIFSKIDI